MLKLKKISTHLDALPEPFRGNAIQAQQINRYAPFTKLVASPKVAVTDAFHWASTLQGRTYWSSLTAHLMVCDEHDK